MKKTQKQHALIFVYMQSQQMCRSFVTSNVTSMNAPYRVRGIETVIEVTFGETVYCTLQYLPFKMLHPQILNFTQYVSVSRCCL